MADRSEKEVEVIVRIQRRENPFVQIDKTALQDARLSWRAKGILAYLLSKPDKWEIQTEDIIKHGSEGRDAVRAAMRELKEFGYAELEVVQSGSQMSGKKWVVFEESRKPENPSVGESESLTSRKPENPSLSNNELFRDNKRRENGDFKLSPEIEEKKKNKVHEVSVYGAIGFLPKEFDTEEFRESMEGFIEMRKRKKKPLTPFALQLVCVKVSAWPAAKATRALNKSTLGGYDGIFDPDENANGKPNLALPIGNSRKDMQRFL